MCNEKQKFAKLHLRDCPHPLEVRANIKKKKTSIYGLIVILNLCPRNIYESYSILH